MSDGKKKIERLNIEPELLRKPKPLGVEYFDHKPIEYKKHTFPFRVRFKARRRQIWGYTKKAFILVKKHPRSTFILIRTFMKIKTNQTSTRAGIALLVTILGLFGIQTNPDLLTEHLQTLIEAAIAIFASITALWAIFKDDEEETE